MTDSHGEQDHKNDLPDKQVGTGIQGLYECFECHFTFRVGLNTNNNVGPVLCPICDWGPVMKVGP